MLPFFGGECHVITQAQRNKGLCTVLCVALTCRVDLILASSGRARAWLNQLFSMQISRFKCCNALLLPFMQILTRQKKHFQWKCNYTLTHSAQTANPVGTVAYSNSAPIKKLSPLGSQSCWWCAYVREWAERQSWMGMRLVFVLTENIPFGGKLQQSTTSN